MIYWTHFHNDAAFDFTSNSRVPSHFSDTMHCNGLSVIIQCIAISLYIALIAMGGTRGGNRSSCNRLVHGINWSKAYFSPLLFTEPRTDWGPGLSSGQQALLIRSWKSGLGSIWIDQCMQVIDPKLPVHFIAVHRAATDWSLGLSSGRQALLVHSLDPLERLASI